MEEEIRDIEILKAIIAKPESGEEKDKAENCLLWTYENFGKQAADRDFDMANWPEPPFRFTNESLKTLEFRL